MARVMTRYTGEAQASATLYTVPAGKIAKIVFRIGSNYENGTTSAKTTVMRINGTNNIAGSTNTIEASTRFDGSILTYTDNQTDYTYKVESNTSPLYLSAAEYINIYTTNTSAIFFYDFIVFEEDV